tara:strand:- start:9 stop:371 length:363 start_codon:yes stop_codon:yes gene_type:complete
MTQSAHVDNKGKRLHPLELSANILGSVREKKAHLWLHEQGYIVFPCMHPTGPIDAVIFNPKTKEYTALDIKSTTGTDGNRPRSKEQIDFGVRLLHQRNNGKFVLTQHRKGENDGQDKYIS